MSATDTAPKVSRPDIREPLAAAVAVLLVAASALAVISGWPFGPAGGVEGLLASPGRSAVAAPAPTGSPPGATESPLPTITASSVSPSVRASRGPTASPPPAVQPGIVVVGAWFRGWIDSTSVTRGPVLAVVENRTSGWVAFPTGASRYSIRDSSGMPTTSGAFAYAFPQRLPPGARAYLVDTLDASFADLSTLVNVTIEPVAVPGEPTPSGLIVSDLTWAETATGGLAASGRVTNPGPAVASGVIVAVVFLDSTGSPLAVLYDPEPRTLADGASQTFTTTYPDTGSLEAADVDHVEAIAGPFEP